MMKLSYKAIIITIAILLGNNCAFAGDQASTENKALSQTHSKILKNYQSVQHINGENLLEMKQEDVVVFDIREQDEFAVSHLEGAIWVDPDIEPSTFLQNHNEDIADKTVILYCSVGVRSSRLAEKLQAELGQNHAIYNLEKGIFGWHNENRPLYQSSSSEQSEPTNYVHPYNRHWGRMVNRDELKRTVASVEK